MRRSPSIVPGTDQDVYLVLDDFGRLKCAWRETNVPDTDLEAVIDDLLEGQYNNPVRVIGFNTAEAGRGTFQRTWPMSCANAARIIGASCPSRFRNSLSGARA
jgi:hypothetical protein